MEYFLYYLVIMALVRGTFQADTDTANVLNIGNISLTLSRVGVLGLRYNPGASSCRVFAKTAAQSGGTVINTLNEVTLSASSFVPINTTLNTQQSASADIEIYIFGTQELYKIRYWTKVFSATSLTAYAILQNVS